MVTERNAMERRDLEYSMVLLGNFLGRAKKYNEIFIRTDGFWNLRTSNERAVLPTAT